MDIVTSPDDRVLCVAREQSCQAEIVPAQVEQKSQLRQRSREGVSITI